MSETKGHEKPAAYDPEREIQFLEETKRFKLYYTCDDCMHFNKEEDRCMEFYPIEALRTPEHPVLLGDRDWLFCKCFEMH